MISVENLSFKYKKNTIIDDLTYQFPSNKVIAVIGESGVGKSTLLNLISSLLKPTSGTITVNTDRIGYVFQEPRLFDWMTALENVSTVSNDKTAFELLSKMGLEDDVNKYPAELSGGMKQRVSIARALAYDPDIMILDEPFKGLDTERRKETSKFVFDALKGKTVIMVTHDQVDLDFADVILELSSDPTTQLKLVKSNT